MCDGSYTGDFKKRQRKKAWCASSIPEGDELTKTNNALDNIEQRGDECADIAQEGRELLNEYGLRYFPSEASDYGGWGGPQFGVLLDENWLGFTGSKVGSLEDPADNTIIILNLEFALAHEIEHAMGRLHRTLPNGNVSELRTPNAVKCSGL